MPALTIALPRIATLSPRTLWKRLRTMAALRQQRLALSTLDDRQLEDIGLTRDDARAEAARPFWDAPHRWRC